MSEPASSRIGSQLEALLARSTPTTPSTTSFHLPPPPTPSTTNPTSSFHTLAPSTPSAHYTALASALELERKEGLIQELSNRVSLLTSYKDKAVTLARRVELAEAASRQREAAHAAEAAALNAKLRAYEDREAAVAGQTAFLESAAAREAASHASALHQARAEADALRAQLAAASKKDPQAEEEAKRVATQLARAREREDAHLRNTHNLQREAAALSDRIRQLEAEIGSETARKVAAVAAADSAKASLDAAQRHIEKLEVTNGELAGALGVSKSQILDLETRLSAAQGVADRVPALEARVARIPELEAQRDGATRVADALREELGALEERMMEQTRQTRTAQDRVAELESRVSSLTSRYVTPTSPSSQLSSLRNAHEELALRSAQLESHLREQTQRAERVQAELETETQGNKVLEGTLAELLAQFQGALQASISGLPQGSSTVEAMEGLLDAPCLENGLGPLASGLYTRTLELARVVDSLRTTEATLQLQLDASQSQVLDKETDLIQTETALQAANDSVARLQAEIQSRDAQIQSLNAQLANLAEVSAREAADTESRLLSLHAAATAIERTLGGSPTTAGALVSLGQLSSGDDEGRPEWDGMTAFFASLPSILSSSYDAIQAKLSASESAAAVMLDKQAASFSARHEEELGTLRAQIHEAKSESLSLQSALSSAREDVKGAQNSASHLQARCAEAHVSQGAALAMLDLVVRAYRAVRIRNRELITQKRFLSSQARALGTLEASIHSLRLALAGSLSASPPSSLLLVAPRKKTSFRGAVIAVIASLRLASFAANPSFVVDREGKDGVTLIPRSALSSAAESSMGVSSSSVSMALRETRIPLSEHVVNVSMGSESETESVTRVVKYFEVSGADEDQHFSPVLLSSLASGQVSHAWWVSQLRGIPQDPESDLAATRAGRKLDPVAPLRGIAVIRKTALDLIQRVQTAESEAESVLREFTVLEEAAADAEAAAADADGAAGVAQRKLEVALLEVSTLQSRMETMVDAEDLMAAEREAQLASQAADDRAVRLEACRTALDERTAEAKELDAEVVRLTERVDELSRANLEAQEKLVGSESCVRELEAQVAVLESDVALLTAQLHDAQVLNTKVQTQLVGAKTHGESQAELHARVSDELDRTRSELRRLESELASAKASASMHASHMLQLNSQVEEARSALAESRAQNVDLSRQLEDTVARVTAAEHSAVLSRDYLVEVQRENNARRARLDSANREAAHYSQFRSLLAAQEMGSGPAGLSGSIPVDRSGLRAYVQDLDTHLDAAVSPSPVRVPSSSARLLSESLASALDGL